MSLITCPSCQKKISDKANECNYCSFSLVENHDEIERLKILNYRKYRNKMYRLKMLSFLSIAIAMAGAVPMLWDYAQAIDYGFDAQFLNHWGIYLLILGFCCYVILRVFMINTRRSYKSTSS